MGDGVLIYFGYPQAHEDDAERAVRAGLAVIEAVGRLAARERFERAARHRHRSRRGRRPDRRGAAQERGVVGETPNLAARLQALAAPDTLVIAEARAGRSAGCSSSRISGRRRSPALPSRSAPGGCSARAACEPVRGTALGRRRRSSAATRNSSCLLRRWQQAKSGEGRVVLVSGEPGIGKSRLTAALSERIESEPHTRLRYFCSPHHQDSALYPFIVQLERAAGFARDDAARAKLDKLAALLGAGSRDRRHLPADAELLSLPGGERSRRSI